MLKRIQKQIIVMISVIILVISQTMTAFASEDISKGNYILAMVLRSCGVCVDDLIYQWRGAYESYLTSTGNQALLNQLKGYDTLSWGANASGIEALRKNVMTWLSSNTTLIDNDGFGYRCFHLPGMTASPKLPTSVDDNVVVGFSRFPENQSYSSDTHSYLFSYSQVFKENGQLLRKKVDVYIPKTNKEVIGYYNSNGLSLCTLNDSGTGVETISFLGYFSHYKLADGALSGSPGLFSSSFLGEVNPQYLMNLPFKIFSSYYARSDYLLHGDDSKALSKGSIPLKCYTSNTGIEAATINNQVSVNNTMKLPSSASAAASCLSNIKQQLNLKDLSSSLGSGGLDIGYFVTYTVQHLRWLVDANGAYVSWDWDNVQTESFTGVIGTNPVIRLKSYPNYVHVNTFPKDEISDNAVYRVFYGGDPEATYPYTIEYYKENELFESVTKTVPMFGSAGTTPRLVDSCEDFCPEYYVPDSASSTSLPYLVSETNNTIKIHYQKDRTALYPYTINYYKDGELLKTLSGTIPVFDSPVISSYENHCPEYYIVDDTLTTPLPYTISKEDNVIEVYYKKDETAKYPYTIEYYQDDTVFKTVSKTVPVFGDTTVTSYDDCCPEYYLLDNDFTTSLPYTVSKEDNLIKVYYKKDLSAKYSYTIEYYKDGQMFKSLPGSVSVFTPCVSSALSFCPAGYTQDTASSTAIPCNITKDGDAIKLYYVKRDSVLPYRVEYYKDGLWMKSSFGNISSSSPSISSVPSYCPDYYKVDTSLSTPLPYTVTSTQPVIKIYYQKDETAKLPYTIEYYKNGQLLDTTTGDVSVFSPHVTSYDDSLCPQDYVLDTTSSSTFPYTVSKDDHVIKVCYVDSGKVLPYTVEHYRGDYLMKTESFNVPVSNPVVNVIWSDCPDGYIIDDYSSTPLPHTITESDNVLRISYLPDMKNPMTSLIHTVIDTTAASSGMIVKVIAILLIPFLLVLMIQGSQSFFKRVVLGGTTGTKRTKTYTAPSTMFMKGVHANKGASIRQKAHMTQGNRPGSMRSKANMKPRNKYRY